MSRLLIAAVATLSLLGPCSGGAFLPFVEVGQITVDHNVITVQLERTYRNPVVIVSDPSVRGSDTCTARVDNVQPGSFDVCLVESSNHDMLHAKETFNYVVFEAGEHAFPDGTKVACGTTASKPSQFAVVDYSGVGFSEPPVVLTQLTTVNDAHFAVTRTKDISAHRFKVAASQEEPVRFGHPAETVAWCAFEGRSSTLPGASPLHIEATTTPRAYNHHTDTVAFAEPFSAAPALIVKVSSFFGGNTVLYRSHAVTATGFSGYLQEDQNHDSEQAHTLESLSFLAIGPTALCANGIVSKDGNVCCAMSCGVCGSCDCAALEGGADYCCRGAIRASEMICVGASDVGCVMPNSNFGGSSSTEC